MKKIFLIIISFLLINQVSAQVIRISPIFSISSFQKFHTSIGYGIGYDLLLKSKNKLGFTFSQNFNTKDYSYVFSSDADGQDYNREVNPKNQKLSLSASYRFDVSKNPKYGFFVGPKIGLNYFKINEFIVERHESETQSFTQNYWENNKIGLGLSLEYERNILSDKLSLSFSTVPELIFFTKFGLMGSSDPPLIGWLNFNLNVMFNLSKSKLTE